MSLTPQHAPQVEPAKEATLTPPSTPVLKSAASEAELLGQLKSRSEVDSPRGTPEHTYLENLAARGALSGKALQRLVSSYLSAEEGACAVAPVSHTFFSRLARLKSRLRGSQGESRFTVVRELRDHYLSSGSPELGFLGCAYALKEGDATHNSIFRAAALAAATGRHSYLRELLKERQEVGQPEVLFHLARLERARGNEGGSNAIEERLISLHSHSLEAKFARLASGAESTTRRRAQLMPLYASFSTRPDQDDSLFGALLLEELLGALPSDKPEHAIAIGRRILTYNPESEAAWAVLIADSADESAGRKLLRECPSWVGTRMLAARARSRGDESAYESLLRQRISSEPSHAEAYIELAQFLGEKGRPSEAQALFRQACLLSPHHPGIPESILEESTLDNSLSIGIRPQLPRQGPPLEVSAWSPQVRSCLAKAAGKKGPALRRTLLTVSPDFFEVDRIIARGSILSAQQAHLLDLCRHLGDAPRRLLGAAPGRATWVESVGDMYQALIPTNHNFPFARVLWELNELTNHALCLDPHGEYLNLQRMLDRLKGTNEGARRAYRRCASLIQAAGDGAGGPHVDAALKYLSEQLDAFHDVVQHELIPSVTNDLPAALERWLNAFSAIEPEEFTRADSQPVAEHSP